MLRGNLSVLAALPGSQLSFKLFELLLEDANLVLLFLPPLNWFDYIGIKVGSQVISIFVSKNRKN